MQEQPDGTGPNPETLRRLAEALPSMVKGLAKGKIGHKGQPVGKPQPRKVCPACGRLHDLVTRQPGEDFKLPERAVCKECQAKLDDGYIALVSICPDPRKGHRCAFVKTEKLADKAGQIMPISDEVMDKVVAKLKAQKAQNDAEN